MASRRRNKNITITIDGGDVSRRFSAFFGTNRHIKVISIFLILGTMVATFVFGNIIAATLLAAAQAVLIDVISGVLMKRIDQAPKKKTKKRSKRTSRRSRSSAKQLKEVRATLARVEGSVKKARKHGVSSGRGETNTGSSSPHRKRAVQGKQKSRVGSGRVKLIIMDFND